MRKRPLGAAYRDCRRGNASMRRGCVATNGLRHQADGTMSSIRPQRSIAAVLDQVAHAGHGLDSSAGHDCERRRWSERPGGAALAHTTSACKVCNGSLSQARGQNDVSHAQWTGLCPNPCDTKHGLVSKTGGSADHTSRPGSRAPLVGLMFSLARGRRGKRRDGRAAQWKDDEERRSDVVHRKPTSQHAVVASSLTTASPRPLPFC